MDREDTDIKEGSEEGPEAKEKICEGELVEVAAKIQGAVQEFGEEIAEFRSFFTGPVPPPELLHAYENALPGLADRLVSMAEKEGEHRRLQEAKALDAEIDHNNKLINSYVTDTRRGQLLAFLIGVFAIGVGGAVAVLGEPEVGGLLGSGGIIGLVSAFINGRKNNTSPDSKKNRPLKKSDSKNGTKALKK
jgi:uncharacterized membrane protein